MEEIIHHARRLKQAFVKNIIQVLNLEAEDFNITEDEFKTIFNLPTRVKVKVLKPWEITVIVILTIFALIGIQQVAVTSISVCLQLSRRNLNKEGNAYVKAESAEVDSLDNVNINEDYQYDDEIDFMPQAMVTLKSDATSLDNDTTDSTKHSLLPVLKPQEPTTMDPDLVIPQFGRLFWEEKLDNCDIAQTNCKVSIEFLRNPIFEKKCVENEDSD